MAYALSLPRQVIRCLSRAFQRLRSDLQTPFSNIAGNAMLSIIIGSVFFNLEPTTSSLFSRSALIFFATLLNAFSSAFEVSARPVY